MSETPCFEAWIWTWIAFSNFGPRNDTDVAIRFETQQPIITRISKYVADQTMYMTTFALVIHNKLEDMLTLWQIISWLYHGITSTS